jgi:steroid 5-alpha reductase family enzyme
MLISDCQKYYTLMYKKGLISTGMFKYTRNPNYFGEMMIYGSFAICVGNLKAFLPLIFSWGILFSMNMLIKDISLRKK